MKHFFLLLLALMAGTCLQAQEQFPETSLFEAHCHIEGNDLFFLRRGIFHVYLYGDGRRLAQVFHGRGQLVHGLRPPHVRAVDRAAELLYRRVDVGVYVLRHPVK